MEDVHKERWVKLNAFIAQLSEAYTLHHEFRDDAKPIAWPLRGLDVMREAIESREHPPETLIGSGSLQAACMWFIYASGRMWANVQGREPCGHVGHVEPRGIFDMPPGTRWEGKRWTGFCRERWDIWRKRLNDASAACTDADSEMKALIEEALGQMERVMGDC